MISVISAVFDSPYLANRAVTRLMENGIFPSGMRLTPSHVDHSPSMHITNPYPVNGNTGIAAMNGGMNAPVAQDNSAGGRFNHVVLDISIPNTAREKTRIILSNCHGRSIREKRE